MNKLNQLCDKIKYHNKLYWEKNTQEISDIEYDKLIRELEELDPTNELLNIHKDDNPVFTSLEKTYYFGESPKGKKSLMNWIDSRARSATEIFLVQPKFDGISVYYDGNNKLISRDQDISDKLPLIEVESGEYIGPLGITPVRGELLIRNDDFTNKYNTIFRKDGSPYKNSRNAVGGIISLKDISNIQKQGAKLTLVDFDLISYAITSNAFLSTWEETVDKIKELPYPMDGIVVKIYDNEYAKSLGSNNTFTKSAIAFKFTRESKQSRILSITWQMGKENLTPVAHIEPIELGGVSITNVTLHNIKYIKKLDIQINDILTIERAGDVIPKVIGSTIGNNRQSPYITICPYCNANLLEIGQELRCGNINCSEKLKQKLYSSVVRLGIEELGFSTICKMWDTLYTRTVIDILLLTVDDIKRLNGFKDKSSIKLFNNIQHGRVVEEYKLLSSLNIPLIGLRASANILQQCSLEDVINNNVDYSAITGVGIEMSKALTEYVIENKNYIDYLMLLVNVESSIVNDKTICFTGKMDMPRKRMHDMAKSVGYNPVNNVTSSLNILVVDDINSNSSKIKKAKKYNIPIVNAKDWLAKI